MRPIFLLFAVLLPLNSTRPSKVPPLAFSVPFTVTEASVNVTPASTVAVPLMVAPL